MEPLEQGPINYDNAFRILLATDNHLGYLESDPVRGLDSFKTFAEILDIARDQQVDFILLGGDLFHHNKPSQTCLYKTMRMLREHCFGNRESKVWIASDQSIHFGDGLGKANYLDENLNISMPVFSIHGNHDDPSGPGNLCPLNVLAEAGMANYFGASTSVEEVVIHPILMTKGASKLALYGLGNIREERLHRLWRSGKVKFMRPESNEEGWQDCFNTFVFHQNRARHGPTSHIPEEFLDGFLDLVVWGHEHECRIHPEERSNFAITQPGSSIATSLSAGEAEPKHVGILTIEEGRYTLDKIKLKTIRPLQFTSVVLSQVETITPSSVKSIQTYLEGVVEQLIESAKLDWESENPNIEMPIPLVRVRVDYSGGYETFNTLQFGQKFIKRVANPKDMLKFQKSSAGSDRNNAIHEFTRASDILSDLTTAIPERLDKVKVEDLVSEYLQKNLVILPEKKLEEAVMILVDKSDRNAISRFVKKSVSQTRESITVLPENIEDLTLEYIIRKSTQFKQAQYSNDDAVSPIPSLQGNTNNDNNNNPPLFGSESPDDNDDLMLSNSPSLSPSPPPQPRSKRGRGSRGGRVRGSASTSRSATQSRKRQISPDSEVEEQSTSTEASSNTNSNKKSKRVLPSSK